MTSGSPSRAGPMATAHAARRMKEPTTIGGGRVQILVSARDEAEAVAAARAGSDLIDLKDPAAGALGAIAPARLAEIVSALRAAGARQTVSATLGDPADEPPARLLARAHAVAGAGVDLVKIGVTPGLQAAGTLRCLAGCGLRVVPVLVADDGVDRGLVRAGLEAGEFAAVMLDTLRKERGSLLQWMPRAELAWFVSAARAAGLPCGLAGALRLEDWPALEALGPDFAGFRSAVCEGSRAGALDERRVAALCRRRLASASSGHDGAVAGALGLEGARQV